VEIQAGPSGLEVGAATKLFKVPPVLALAATPDGERMLLAALPQVAGATRVALVTNWTAGLEKK